MERDYRARYKQRVERQFRIGVCFLPHVLDDPDLLSVKPNATPDEVNAVVNDMSGGGDQVFAQAVRNLCTIVVNKGSWILDVKFNSIWRIPYCVPRGSRSTSGYSENRTNARGVGAAVQ